MRSVLRSVQFDVDADRCDQLDERLDVADARDVVEDGPGCSRARAAAHDRAAPRSCCPTDGCVPESFWPPWTTNCSAFMRRRAMGRAVAEAPEAKEDSGNIPGVRTSVKARGGRTAPFAPRARAPRRTFDTRRRDRMALDTPASRPIRCPEPRTVGLALARGGSGGSRRGPASASGLLHFRSRCR